MASRIKGITVEIGGDTTGLEKALKSVNTSIKSTETALKDVNRLLKLDPSNTELLSQKQKLLKDAIGETKEKLDALKTAQEQAKQQFENGDLGQDKYDALQREIIETEQQLKSLQKQAASTSAALAKIEEAGSKLKSAGQAVTEVSKKGMVVTGALAAVGTSAVKTAADFDAAMSKVAAVSGATGDDLDALREKAREMGERTKFSASEAAEAMNYMAMAGWKTGDMLDGIEGIMNLAAASGENLGTTSDIVTDALTAFGLTASDSGHFADILAAASSNANTNVSMMGETFKYCAPIAGALGFSAEDTAEAIGLMANAGIKSSQAGTSLRTIMNSLTGDIEFCGKNIGEVTVATTNADGSMRDLSDILADCRKAFRGLTESENAAVAESLVGKNAMSGFLALMNAAPTDIEKLSGAIENCNGAAAGMAATMQDNLTGRLTALKSKLESLAISFGEILMPAVEKIVGKISALVDWLNGLDEGTKNTIVTAALFVAALAPIGLAIGGIMTTVGSVMTAIPKITTAISTVMEVISGLWAVLMANPIILIAGAIIAAIAAIAIWGDEIKTVILSVDDFLMNIFSADMTQLFGPVLGGIMNGWLSQLRGIWTAVRSVLTGLIDFIRGVFTGDWERAWNGVKDALKGVMDGIIEAVKAPIDTVIGLFDSAISKVQEFFSGLDIGGKISSVGDWFSSWDIPFFASGGALSAGNAIVGEAGPELLSVRNGTAYVQPMNNTGAASQAAATITGETAPINIVVQSVLDGRIIGQTVTQYQRGRERAYG